MSWEQRRDKAFSNASALRVEKFKKLLKLQYGFLADPIKPVRSNMEDYLRSLTVHEYLSIPLNRSCHNLILKIPLPSGIRSLLGLGSNFCLQSRSSTNNIETTIERYCNDVRRVLFFKNKDNLLPEQEGSQYNPKLYFKSDWLFSPASKLIELTLKHLSADFQKLQARYTSGRCHPNLTQRK